MWPPPPGEARQAELRLLAPFLSWHRPSKTLETDVLVLCTGDGPGAPCVSSERITLSCTPRFRQDPGLGGEKQGGVYGEGKGGRREQRSETARKRRGLEDWATRRQKESEVQAAGL